MICRTGKLNLVYAMVCIRALYHSGYQAHRQIACNDFKMSVSLVNYLRGNSMIAGC